MSDSTYALHELQHTICKFPKYKGDTWYDVIQHDREYVRWLVENIEDLNEDLFEVLSWGVDNVPDRI